MISIIKRLFFSIIIVVLVFLAGYFLGRERYLDKKIKDLKEVMKEDKNNIKKEIKHNRQKKNTTDHVNKKEKKKIDKQKKEPKKKDKIKDVIMKYKEK